MTAREWTLTLPFTRPLTMNTRHTHWARERAATAAWRDAAIALARRDHIPPMDRFTAVLHYAPRHERRRDVDNLMPSLKHLVDGLVRAGVCQDDDHTRYTLTSPVIHPATGEPGRLWLVVIELAGTATGATS